MLDILAFEAGSEVGNPSITLNGVPLVNYRVVSYDINYGVQRIFHYGREELVYEPRLDYAKIVLQSPGGMSMTLEGRFVVKGDLNG